MAKRKRLISHKLLPSFWGLSGKTLEQAKFEYYLNGVELEIALAKLNYSGKDLDKKLLEINSSNGIIDIETYKRNSAHLELEGKELEKKLLEIDKEFNRIDEETFERNYSKLNFDSEEAKQLIDIEMDFKYGKIKEREYEKRKATLKKEPWVYVVLTDFDPKNPNGAGAFTLDWNEHWIERLKKFGYTGPSDGFIMQSWVDALHARIAIDSGILNEDGEKQVISSIRHDDGRVEYS